MERCKESAIVAERFKASTKKINQSLVDVIVSVKTGCRAYQVVQPVIREQAGQPREEEQWDKDGCGDDKCYKRRWGTIDPYPNTLSDSVHLLQSWILYITAGYFANYALVFQIFEYIFLTSHLEF